MFKQLLECGAATGAMVREAEHAESRTDFIRRFFNLFNETSYLSEAEYAPTQADIKEILKLLIRIIKISNQKVIVKYELTIVNFLL